MEHCAGWEECWGERLARHRIVDRAGEKQRDLRNWHASTEYSTGTCAPSQPTNSVAKFISNQAVLIPGTVISANKGNRPAVREQSRRLVLYQQRKSGQG